MAKNKVWRVAGLDGPELLHAENVTQTFPKHTHEHYAVGVIERGALGFFYRGENVVAGAGNVNLCVPGEVHTGHPALPGGWSYRMFYLEPSALQSVASEIADRPRELPFFRSGVIADPALAQQLYGVHRRLETPTPRLEGETLFLGALAQLISRHADAPLPMTQAAPEPHAVKQVKGYLETHYAEAVSLEQLSHLTRWFGRLWGYTPGQYQNANTATPYKTARF